MLSAQRSPRAIQKSLARICIFPLSTFSRLKRKSTVFLLEKKSTMRTPCYLRNYSVADPGCLSRMQGQKDSGCRIRIRIKEFKCF
jgi:hypothetical protein